MKLGRRTVLKIAGATAAGVAASPATSRGTIYVGTPGAREAAMLVDTTLCAGCRACEAACAEANGLPDPDPGDVFARTRLTSSTALTVVNRFENGWAPQAPRYVKRQCMHCVEPSCASACPVRALEKLPFGPVTYHAGRWSGAATAWWLVRSRCRSTSTRRSSRREEVHLLRGPTGAGPAPRLRGGVPRERSRSASVASSSRRPGGGSAAIGPHAHHVYGEHGPAAPTGSTFPTWTSTSWG
jgi:ferredoxin